MSTSLPPIYGIDGCRAGWLVISFDGQALEMALVTTLSALRIPDTSIVFIDMPIGLSEGGPDGRACDRLVRRQLSPVKHSSVFTPPCRAAVYADRADAIAVNVGHTGKKLSQQSLNIVPKIRELDAFLQARSAAVNERWYEAHPELVFALLNDGQPLVASKKTEEGRAARLALLAPFVSQLTAWWGGAQRKFLRKYVQLDDIIDALALAVAAYWWQSGEGRLRSFPDEAARDGTGLRMRIVGVER